MSEIKGYMGKILRVDMTTKTTSEWDVGDEYRRKYFGGAAMGARIIWDEVPPETDEFGRENKVALLTSPVTGSPTFAASLVNVSTKSPLIGNMLSAQLNGNLGRAIKTAGYDGIIIEGVSDSWQYLTLIDGAVEFHGADELIGKDCFATEIALREKHAQPKASVFCIGPAGENLVRYAAIEADNGHFASSGGSGAVLGSKKLKAFLVAPGSHKIEVADPEGLKKCMLEFKENIDAYPATKAISLAGTNSTTAGLVPLGMVPFKNLQQSEWEGFGAYDAFKIHNDDNGVTFKKDSCYFCPIGHCYSFEFTDGVHKGIKGDEAEYEGWASFGMNLLIEDPLEALYLNYLNDCMGMDLKEQGFMMGWVIEAFDKGYLTTADTDGLEFSWGDPEPVKELIGRIARREGSFADRLAEGIWRASQQYGEEAAKLAVWGKRHSPHAHDPRAGFGLAFQQAMSDMGSMNGGNPMSVDAACGYPEMVDRTDQKAMQWASAKGSKRSVFKDTMLLCMFVERTTSTELLTNIVNLVTGIGYTPKEAMDIGDRANQLHRAFALKAGLGPEDDALSYRLLVDAPAGGMTAGIPLAPLFAMMKEGWYDGMGWDQETSKPLPETLKELELEDLVPALWG